MTLARRVRFAGNPTLRVRLGVKTTSPRSARIRPGPRRRAAGGAGEAARRGRRAIMIHCNLSRSGPRPAGFQSGQTD